MADMIINKVCCIKDVLDMAVKENRSNDLSDILKQASDNINELIDWVKFLQIAHDHRDLISMLSETNTTHERRREKRYPLSEKYQKYITVRINTSGTPVAVFIIDFSMHGVKFKSPVSFDVDSIKEGTLSSSYHLSKEVSFKVKIRYCAEHNGEFTLGGQIVEIADNMHTDFFKKVHEFIIEMLVQKSKKHEQRLNKQTISK